MFLCQPGNIGACWLFLGIAVTIAACILMSVNSHVGVDWNETSAKEAITNADGTGNALGDIRAWAIMGISGGVVSFLSAFAVNFGDGCLKGRWQVLLFAMVIVAVCLSLTFANFDVQFKDLYPDENTHLPDTLGEAVFGIGDGGDTIPPPPGDGLTGDELDHHTDAVDIEIQVNTLENETNKAIVLAEEAVAAEVELEAAKAALATPDEGADIAKLEEAVDEAKAKVEETLKAAQDAAKALSDTAESAGDKANGVAQGAEDNMDKGLEEAREVLKGDGVQTVDMAALDPLSKRLGDLKLGAEKVTSIVEALQDNNDITGAKELLAELKADANTITTNKEVVDGIVARAAAGAPGAPAAGGNIFTQVQKRRLCQIEVAGPDPSPNALSYGILLLGFLMLTWLFYAIRKRYRYVQPKLHHLQQVVVHMPSGLVQLLYKKHHE